MNLLKLMFLISAAIALLVNDTISNKIQFLHKLVGLFVIRFSTVFLLNLCDGVVYLHSNID